MILEELIGEGNEMTLDYVVQAEARKSAISFT